MYKLTALILALLMVWTAIPALAEETAPTAAPAATAVPAPVEEPAASEEPEIILEDKWMNILLLGGDARDMNKYDRSDCMIILSINPGRAEAKMTSIMRDTWVSIPGKKNNKINAAALFGGPELAVQTVNENFGTDIEHYILINMADMADIVNLFGGVEINVSASERKIANDYIGNAESSFYNERLGHKSYDYTRIAETGLIHLSGVQAMAYCRDRYTDSDFQRVMRQQETMLALAAKAQNMETEEVLQLAGQIGEFVSTNLEKEQILMLAKAALLTDIETVGQYRIPAEGAYESGTFDGTWMIRPDLKKCTASLHDFIYGEEN